MRTPVVMRMPQAPPPARPVKFQVSRFEDQAKPDGLIMRWTAAVAGETEAMIVRVEDLVAQSCAFEIRLRSGPKMTSLPLAIKPGVNGVSETFQMQAGDTLMLYQAQLVGKDPQNPPHARQIDWAFTYIEKVDD